jgi:type VI protein secretion system component Hcp
MTIALSDLPIDPLIAGLPAVESYLSIGDIRGDSAAARHEGWIDVHAHSWEVTRGPARGGAGAGRARSAASLSPLRVRCALDSSGPLLFRAAAQGRSFPEALLEVVAAPGSVILTWRMENVQVSSYQLTAVGTHPVQSFEVEAEKVTFTHRRIAADGSTGAEVSHTWDVRSGR